MRFRLIAFATLTAASLAACTDAPAPQARPRPTPTPSIEASAPELTRTRIPVPGQPSTLLYDRGSLWVGGSLLVRLENDRIVQRLRTAVSRNGIVLVGGRLWATGGGDGAVPDGTVVAFQTDGGEAVERLVFPDQSPYGIDAGGKGIFVALFQGDLLRMTSHGTSSIPLSNGLTQVLVAHGKAWVSSPQSAKVWRVVTHGRDDTGAAATELKSMAKKTCPQGLDSSQTAIWVADPCAHKVWLLDPRSGEVMDVIEGLGKPIDVDVTGTRAWIVSFRDNLVSVVDVDSFQILAQGRAGHGATAIAAHGREAWVANHEGYSLTHLKLP